MSVASEIGERVQQLCDEGGIGPVDLERRAGFSRNSLFRWRTGTSVPSVESLLLLVGLFPGLDLHWLITGERRHESAEAAE